jgi:hypothetical protein
MNALNRPLVQDDGDHLAGSSPALFRNSPFHSNPTSDYLTHSMTQQVVQEGR